MILAAAVAEMSWQGWYTLAVLILVLGGLIREAAPPDLIMLTGALLVTIAQIVTPQEFLSGFANNGMLTVAALFVVAAALYETGALDDLGRIALGKAKTESGALLRLSWPLAGLSAFLNNTTIVAMAMPIVIDWCRKNQVSPSRMLLPISYFAILGGTCTLIGTSTNLVVNGMMVEAAAEHESMVVRERLHGMGMFELAWVGVPYATIGIAYILLIGRRFLPNRKDLIQVYADSARDYLVDMLVRGDCVLVGKRVEEAGLRALPGLFLIEISRNGETISPVGPREMIQAGDILTFTGVVTTIVELERFRGLVPATEEAAQGMRLKAKERHYTEAVISPTSPLVGVGVRESGFRRRYNAAVVAVHRNGHRLSGRVGDITLHAGDTLLLQAGEGFAQTHRENTDFILVSGVSEARPVRHARSRLAMFLGLALIVLLSGGWFEESVSAMIIVLIMIGAGCISAGQARRSIAWDVVITIAASFALGTAMENSGAAAAIASTIIGATHALGPLAALSVIYLLTMVVTEMITNNAAAALVFPLALSTAIQLDVDPRPFAMAVAFAASACFSTPIGYQTNLMVFGPGGYKFTDYFRVGIPMNVLLWIAGSLLIPLVWPLATLSK